MGPSMRFLLLVSSIAIVISWASITVLGRLIPSCNRLEIKAVFWTVNALIMVGTLFGREWLDGYSFSAAVVKMAVAWFMAQLFVIGLALLYYAAAWLMAWLTSSVAAREFDPSRRRWLARGAYAVPAAAAGLSLYGAFYGSRKIEYYRHEVKLNGLPPELAGFTIAQISDVHIGMFFSPERLAEVLREVAQRKPDVLVITGDLIDEVADTEKTVRYLEQFTGAFPHGIYFVYGNHEYFRDFNRIWRALENSSIKVLQNENACLSENGRPLYLLGVDYPWADGGLSQEAACRTMLEEALFGVPDGAVKIMLGHHSAVIDAAFERRVDLTLTGHTHGGQVRFLGQTVLPVRYKYMRGMYQSGGSRGYVHSGTGSWFPFRMNCPAEVSFFELR